MITSIISHISDAVLFAALLVTALCVGSMYRELRRLRGYQAQYLRVFDETKEAVGEIEAAIGAINREGRDILKDLGGRIDEARVLVVRLEALTAAAAADDTGADNIGTYSRATPGDLREQAERIFGSEIVRIGAHRPSGPAFEPVKSFRMAPSVRTLKAAGGVGA